eukprot:gene6304-8683_t
MNDTKDINNLSVYEQYRIENIERNNAFLKSLGLPCVANSNYPITKSKSNGKKKKSIFVENSCGGDYNHLRRKSQRLQDKPEINYHITVESNRTKPTINGYELNNYDTIESAGMSLNGKFLGELDKTQQQSAMTAVSDNSSSRNMEANIEKFTNMLHYLCKPIEEYGKAAVMLSSVQPLPVQTNTDTKIEFKYNIPKFNKYSGVTEWKNAVYLWVNIGGKEGYHNAFTGDGRYMMWFGGSKMNKDSPVVLRLLQSVNHSINLMTPVEESSANKTSQAHDTILLFVRLEGENYCSLGRLKPIGYDLNTTPIRIQWELLDYDSIHSTDHFKAILRSAE